MKLPENSTIIIFSNQGLSPLHFGHEQEITDLLLEQGNQLYSISCNNVLTSCYYNPSHNLVACAVCESRCNTFQRKGNSNINYIKLERFSINNEITFEPELDKIIQLEYKGINIGRGVASSIISTSREYSLEAIPNINDIIKINIEMAINCILNFKKFIKEFNPSGVFLFNGRFAEVHAIVELCKSLELDVYTYESGGSKEKYIVKKNTTVHNISSFQEDMHELSRAISMDKIVKEGKKIFSDRIKGVQDQLYNFNKFQEKGLIPNNFDDSKNNIALFNSSEDEMKVIKDWEFNLYSFQNEAIMKIIDFYKGDENVHIYLRCHPNLLDVANTQTKELNSFKSDNLTIIGSEETIDTYSLIKACDKTVTFGSTVGIEATYLSKPSILLGNSFYKGMGCVYEPETFESLFELLDSKNLDFKKNDNIYLYIYTAFKKGILLKKLEDKGAKGLYYDSRKIKRFYVFTPVYFFKYLKNWKLWRRMNYLILGHKIGYKDIFRLKSHTRNKIHIN